MGPAILSEDAAAIGSALSYEESEDPGGSKTSSSVARRPTAAELLAVVEAASEALEAGDVSAAGARLRIPVAALRASVTAGKLVALLRQSQ